MKKRWVAIGVMLLIAAVAASLVNLGRTGLSARTSPPALEAFAATEIRHWTVPSRSHNLVNPTATTEEATGRGRAHWADHCASCHANNGSGDTEIGRNLYPRAPDMRAASTQVLTDGELYYIIRNGIPLTGMPAWGDPRLGDHDSETWMLVTFIRHLPRLSADEEAAMEKLNPKSPMEMQEEQQEEEFLNGKSPTEGKHEH